MKHPINERYRKNEVGEIVHSEYQLLKLFQKEWSGILNALQDMEGYVMTIRAVYRDGVFRPIVPVAIKEGTEVDIPYEPKQNAPTPEQVKAEVKRILSLPQDNRTSFDGLDHDKILYGEPLSS